MVTAGGVGEILDRGDTAYDKARRDTMWNANVPARFPDRIVRVDGIDDVVGAVRAAKETGQQIGIRSGGHGWSGNHVRDGGVLLDLSRLRAVTIDRQAMTAIVEPGLSGSDFVVELLKHDLFFPVGHCRGVGLGGYLLQGGFGFNSRALGPACSSVIGIDYVDANGDLKHASQTENSEMLWAARGSGPDFVGIVVRFHLRLHRKPGFIGNSAFQYPIDRLEDVVRWMDRISTEVPPQVELQFVISRNPSFPPPIRPARRAAPVRIEVAATVMADDRQGARDALSFLSTRPKRARIALPMMPTPMGVMFSAVMQHYPAANWETDNLWTHATADELLPHLLHAAETLPPPPAHMLWLNWAPPPQREDMAFTVEDRTYLAFYGGWYADADADATTQWSRGHVAALQSLSTGVQFADDPGRPSRAISEVAQARLARLRASQDPEGRFHRWIGAL